MIRRTTDERILEGMSCMDAKRNELLVIGDSGVMPYLLPLLQESEVPACSAVFLSDEPYPPAGTLFPGTETGLIEGRSVSRNQEEREWKETIGAYPVILLALSSLDLILYRKIFNVCAAGGKILLPAAFARGLGLLGPMTARRSDACLESAWRRLHVPDADNAGSADNADNAGIPCIPGIPGNKGNQASPGSDRDAPPSSLLYSILSNVMVHYAELYLETRSLQLHNQVYVFHEAALEGRIYPVERHPLAGGSPATGSSPAAPIWVPLSGAAVHAAKDEMDLEALYSLLARLASPHTGILYELDEGDFIQLPLSVCRSQSTDPLAPGPAGKLPAALCAGYTHWEARREAGLTGLQAYTARLAERLCPSDHGSGQTCIGVGTTYPEAIGRALQSCLEEKAGLHGRQSGAAVFPIRLGEVKDPRCSYYLQSLNQLAGKWELYWSEGAAAAPVIWVHADSKWYAACDLNLTYALRRVLVRALLDLQTGFGRDSGTTTGITAVAGTEWDIPQAEENYQAEDVKEMLTRLANAQWSVETADLAVEEFMSELCVYGVRLKGGQDYE
ncbi:hypothetical protein [Paenibacillus pinistramenti]|uniref:hypothetical protein n=1 Tax=Paenibacillus pinistramenti TaxID=1768003 RepID=UPI001109A8C7|nr:hypothetical protein [Paenibacillus pinistramenti]